jgi:4-amino-4-deoxy-L-arabinose transferase-like glycosyltransferase
MVTLRAATFPKTPMVQRNVGQRRTAPPRQNWMVLACSGAIVGGALLLRLYRLGAQELWVDEAFSFYMGTAPHTVGGLLVRSSPPLYYLLLRAWVGVAGSSEAALRSLSALTGTLFVAAVIWAGREIVDARVGLWSGLMAAVAPLHIYYSQEARAYALLTLTLILTYGLLWRALATNAWRWWALVSAGMLLATFTHYLAVLGLLPTAYLVMVWPGPSRWRRYATALLGSGVLLLPWIVWSFLLTRHSLAGLDWVGEIWKRTPPLLAIPRSLEVFGLGSQAGLLPIQMKQFSDLSFPAPLRLLGVLMLCTLGLWVALPFGERQIGVPWVAKRKAWLGMMLCVPLALMWVISFFRPLYVVGRYDVVAFPPFPLLLGLALRKLQQVKRAGVILATGATLLLFIPVGAKLVRYYQAPSHSDAHATAQVLHAFVEHGDAVVFTGLRGLPVLYYLHGLGYRWEGGYCQSENGARRFACRMFPREIERRPAVRDLGRILTSPTAVHDDVADFLHAIAPSGGALWVALESASLSRGMLYFHNTDALLLAELQRLNLRPVAVPGAPLIFRYEQP